MVAMKQRLTYLFSSTRGLALVGIAILSLVTATWGMLSGPMVEWGVKDVVVQIFGMDLIQAEREGRIVMLYHTIAMTVIAIEVYFITGIVPMKKHQQTTINATVTIGYLVSTVVVLASMFWLFGERRKLVLLLYPVVISTVLYFFFQRVLIVSLPHGVLFH